MKRVVYFDYLRMIATCAVIILHVAVKSIYSFEIGTLEWKILVFYDSLVRFSVPIFIMISGALLLGKEHNVKEIFTKRIFRIITAYIFWSLLYALINPNIIGIKAIILETIKGHSHMWFLPMIVGLYLSIPVLSLVSKNREVLKYFIVISLIFSFSLPTLTLVARDFGTDSLVKLTETLTKTVSLTNVGAVSGYFGYFVLGYFLNTESIDEKIKKVIYFLGVIGIFMTHIFTVRVSGIQNNLVVDYFSNISLNVFFVSVMVFILGKTYLNKYDNKVVKNLSKYTFGVYLVHALIISKVYEYLDFSLLHPIVEVPIVSALVLILSLLISCLFNKIPMINKYLI